MLRIGFGREQKVFSMNEMHAESLFLRDYVTSRNGYCKRVTTSTAKHKRVFKNHKRSKTHVMICLYQCYLRVNSKCFLLQLTLLLTLQRIALRITCYCLLNLEFLGFYLCKLLSLLVSSYVFFKLVSFSVVLLHFIVVFL